MGRKRAVTLFRFFIFGFCGILAVYGIVRWTGHRKHHSCPIHIVQKNTLADSTIAPAGPVIHHIAHLVKHGETFMNICTDLKIARARAAVFHRALTGAGLSKLYPGDSLVLVLHDSSDLDTLSFLSRLQYWYHAAWDDSGAVAQRRPLAVTLSRGLVSGVLETSLLDAMEKYGIGPYLACKLSDIFAWDINFFLDPRKGDTFQIIFTQKYAEGRCIGYGDVLAARYTCHGKDFYAIGIPDSQGTLQYYDLDGRSVQKEFLKAPLRYSRISSYFTYHRLHPILGIVRPHLGIDYAAPTGTPVYAAADGIVREAGWDNDYGNHIEIAHGGAFTTCYGHLSSISSGVRRGAHVTQGQMIGAVGATGLATGPHLDYRMKRNGAAVNPLTVNLPSKEGIARSEEDVFNRARESYLALFTFRGPRQPAFRVLDAEQLSSADTSEKPRNPTPAVMSNGVKPGT